MFSRKKKTLYLIISTRRKAILVRYTWAIPSVTATVPEIAKVELHSACT